MRNRKPIKETPRGLGCLLTIIFIAALTILFAVVCIAQPPKKPAIRAAVKMLTVQRVTFEYIESRDTLYELQAKSVDTVGRITGGLTIIRTAKVYKNFYASLSPPVGSIVSNDGSAVMLGTQFQTLNSMYVHGIRYYRLTGMRDPVYGELYNVTTGKLYSFPNGALLKSLSVDLSPGWVTIWFENLIRLPRGEVFIACLWSTQGDFLITPDFSPVSTDLLYLGTRYDYSEAMPRQKNNSNYFIDIKYTK